MRYLFVDTETTGLPDYALGPESPAQPRVVQLAARLEDEVGAVRGLLSVLIRPDGWDVPPQAAAIHGIDRETAAEYGVPATLALLALGALAPSDGGVSFVAHNAEFDLFMIQREAHAVSGLPFVFADVVCTMGLAREIMRLPATPRMVASGRTGYKPPRLEEACAFFGVPGSARRHDAMADAEACSRLFHAVRGRGDTSP